MEIGFFLLINSLNLARLAGNAPLDVGPDPSAWVGLSFAAICVIGLFVVGIIVGAVFVIRSIKKNRTNRDRS